MPLFGSKPAAIETLKDTTLRPICFGISADVPMEPEVPCGLNPFSAPKQRKVKAPVNEGAFKAYTDTLGNMGKLARLVYCDAGIMFDCLKEFPKLSAAQMNDKITSVDNARAAERKGPAPAASYTKPAYKASGSELPFATYGASVSDMTFLVISCKALLGDGPEPFAAAREQDAVISFKGSSSNQDAIHDFMAQAKVLGTDMRGLLKTYLNIDSKAADSLLICDSFLKPILVSWKLIKDAIDKQITKPESRLFVTGQSLGAARAHLFGFVMAEALEAGLFPNIKSIHIVSFGAPTCMKDDARNRFNDHLDSGRLTLDREVSYLNLGVKKWFDIVPDVPQGFSHPGFRPLKTELCYVERRTGRAYNIERLKGVYSGGGEGKAKFVRDTKTHMPNLIQVPTDFKPFPHGGYAGLTYGKVWRFPGMKNPGKKVDGVPKTFVARFYETGLDTSYVDGASEPAAPEVTVEPTPDGKPGGLSEIPSPEGGKRRTLKNRRFKRKVGSKSARRRRV